MERKRIKSNKSYYTRVIGIIWKRQIEAELFPKIDSKRNRYKLFEGKVWHKGNRLKIEDFSEIISQEQIEYEKN